MMSTSFRSLIGVVSPGEAAWLRNCCSKRRPLFFPVACVFPFIDAGSSGPASGDAVPGRHPDTALAAGEPPAGCRWGSVPSVRTRYRSAPIGAAGFAHPTSATRRSTATALTGGWRLSTAALDDQAECPHLAALVLWDAAPLNRCSNCQSANSDCQQQSLQTRLDFAG